MRVYADRRMALLFALGFSSGLPLALTGTSLSAWVRLSGLSLATVGLFSAVATPYALKFLWAPVVDRAPLPFLTRRMGQRRSWLLVFQLALVVAIGGLADADPAVDPWRTALMAVIVATASASQDIVVDAYRVDLLALDEQGAGAAVAVFGYRVAMIVSGAGTLYISQILGRWHIAYLAMAVCMGVGIIATALAAEPDRPADPGGAMPPGVLAALARHFREGVVGPLSDLTRRRGWLLFLLFILLFKVGDALAGVMTMPLLIDLKFTPIEIANVNKTFGLVMSIAGIFAGGWLVRGVGVVRALWIGGVLQLASNGMFCLQAWVGRDIWMLTATIGVEQLSGGLGTAAFVAYLSGLCRKRYSATQYALLVAVSGVARKLLAAPSGVAAQALGYVGYFGLTALAAAPGLLVLYLLDRWRMTGLAEP